MITNSVKCPTSRPLAHWRDPATVKRTAKILLHCLVVLGLMLTAAAGASAGTRAFDHIESAAGQHYLEKLPCKKFEIPNPLEHQCHRAASQAPVSSRPRSSDKSDLSDTLTATPRPTLREHGTTFVATLSAMPFRASRRSSFWQVFAYSARLRN